MPFHYIIVEGFCCLLSLGICSYRFYLRLFKTRRFVWVEITLLLGLLLQSVLFGVHTAISLTSPKTKEGLLVLGKLWTAGAFLYSCSLWTVKISINLLHIRLTEKFPRSHTWAIRSVYIIICCWVFVSIDMSVSCRPLSRRWKSLIGEAVPCRPIAKSWDFWTNSSLNIITDIWLGILPFPALAQLRTKPKLRAAIFFVYGLAFLTVIVTTIRNVLIGISPTDFAIPIYLLSMFEVTTIIVVAAIPTISTSFLQRVAGEGNSSYMLGRIKSTSRSQRKTFSQLQDEDKIGSKKNASSTTQVEASHSDGVE